MYNMGDSSWSNRPAVMPIDILEATALQIAKHAGLHNLSDVEITIHGGEPLLLGIDKFKIYLETLLGIANKSGLRLHFGVQTNGTLLSAEWTRLFTDYNIGVGISIDVLPESHNRLRVDHAGVGSYERLTRALDSARTVGRPGQYIGSLSVIDLASDPVRVLDHLISLGFSDLDFLLPDANFEQSPPGKRSFESAEYGDWLIRLFDAWMTRNDSRVRIRLFSLIIKSILGRPQGFDSIGFHRKPLAVIETDGSIFPLDDMRIVPSIFYQSSLNVLRHSFECLLVTPLARQLMSGAQALSSECRACRHLKVCGGGSPAHRYGLNRKLDNTSVYCRDLYRLIGHIEDHLRNLITLSRTT